MSILINESNSFNQIKTKKLVNTNSINPPASQYKIGGDCI